MFGCLSFIELTSLVGFAVVFVLFFLFVTTVAVGIYFLNSCCSLLSHVSKLNQRITYCENTVQLYGLPHAVMCSCTIVHCRKK